MYLQLRIRAHCKPNKRGVVKASENILKLWKTEKGRRSHVLLVDVAVLQSPDLGEELHGLLLQHGNMEEVECQLEQIHEDEDEEQLQGGHHCKATLQQMGWTETLVSIHY